MQEEMRTGKEGGRGSGEKDKQEVSLVPESELDPVVSQRAASNEALSPSG